MNFDERGGKEEGRKRKEGRDVKGFYRRDDAWTNNSRKSQSGLILAV